MSMGFLRVIAALTVALPAFVAAAEDASPRGPLPGVAVPGTALSSPATRPPPTAPIVSQRPPPLPPSTPKAPAISPTARLYIAALQRALPSHGYHPGPETGRLDRKTIAAIKAYQRDAGLPIDARSEMTLKTTLDSVTFVKPPILAH